MIRNYLTTFFRNLSRQKLYSTINLLGLATGIASTLLIALYVTNELSYDKFHADADKIYRLGTYVNFKGQENWHVINSANAPEVFIKDFPEVEAVMRVRKWPVTPIQVNDQVTNVEKVILADSNFFSFFSFKLIDGNSRKALVGKNKIVLTESTAKNLFGNNYASSIGKLVIVGDSKASMEITGIMADPPSNAHFHFDAIVSMATLEPFSDWYVGLSTYDYFKVKEPEGAVAIQEKLREFSLRYMGPEIERITSRSLADVLAGGDIILYFMQPITAIHLDSHFLGEMETNGERSSLYLLSCISALALVLACINFINLVTARAINRAKEVGIRKAIGAIRQRLVIQFMLESFLSTSIALALAIILLIAVIRPFNSLVSTNLDFTGIFTLPFMLGMMALLLFISVVSGLYPALYITAFKPVLALKGNMKAGSKGFGVRNSLVTFQFVISIFMVVSTISVYNQIRFLQDRDPGFQKENMICITNAGSLKTNSLVFKEELLRYPGIVNVSFSSRLPSEIIGSSGYRKAKTEQWQTLSHYDADVEHLSTLGLTLKSGRFFSKDFPSDSNACILNEAAATLMNISDTNAKGELEDAGNYTTDVIGIVSDFNFESAKAEIKPLVLYLGGKGRMSIRVQPGSIQDKVQIISELWSKNTDAPLEYSFLDENLARQYEGERKLQKISTVFTVLAMFIASLGLLGLITFIASQRTKEIGIRKVLGASATQLVALLSKDFLKLIIIAFVIAVPVSWAAINKWLEEFAYHIDFSWIVAVVAGVVVLVVALLTISFQATKLALANPVDSLRSE